MIHNSGKQQEFATLTGINGFLVLILITLLYCQKLIFLRLKVIGYAIVYEKLIEKINFLQYFYTFIAVVIMILLVITQVYSSPDSSNYNFVHSARENEYIVFFVMLVIELIVFIGIVISIFIQVKKINELPPDSLSYSNQSVQEIVRQQNYAIQKSLQHMFDLYDNLQQLQEQEKICSEKNLNAGFVKTQLEVKQLKKQVYNYRDQIDQMQSRVQSKQREEKRLKGEVAGLKREI